MMKKIILSFLSIAAAIAFAGCAKDVPNGPNDANKRYFDAWMKVNHPDVKPTGLGIYVLEEEAGTGKEVEMEGYVLMDYKTTDLEGNISTYTDSVTAKQLGTYNVGNYYGPKFQTTIEKTVTAGLAEALVGMKVGGRKKVIIPSWLLSYSTYDSEEDYLAASTSAENTVYDITVRDFTTDIFEWQVEKIGGYFKENSSTFGAMTVTDSIPNFKGFYYKSLSEVKDTTSFPSDTTIYINYTGRLLNGDVFDTTNERLAKDCGIWSASRTYEPVLIKWGEAYSDLTMGSESSTVISGFALTLWQMHKFEKGIGVFVSDYGYGYSGSGESIPGYSPLVFEIEVVAKPEED